MSSATSQDKSPTTALHEDQDGSAEKKKISQSSKWKHFGENPVEQYRWLIKKQQIRLNEQSTS